MEGTEGVHRLFLGYGPPSLWWIQVADLKGGGFHERIQKAQDRPTRPWAILSQPIQGWMRDKRNAQEVVQIYAKKEGPTQIMVLWP